MSSEDLLRQAEELHARLVAARAELERAAEAEDHEQAVEVLQELADLAREVEAALSRAKREAESGN